MEKEYIKVYDYVKTENTLDLIINKLKKDFEDTTYYPYVYILNSINDNEILMLGWSPDIHNDIRVYRIFDYKGTFIDIKSELEINKGKSMTNEEVYEYLISLYNDKYEIVYVEMDIINNK